MADIEFFTNLMLRARFAGRMLHNYLFYRDKSCPYCNSMNVRYLGRKVILKLYRCEDCGLRYRYPKDSPGQSLGFYNCEYSSGAVTYLPDDTELKDLLSHNFEDGSLIDIRKKVSLVLKWTKADSVLCWGCSWGYEVYQFKTAGCLAVGYEISRPRAKYGRNKLGCQIYDSIDELTLKHRHSFDCIFLNHVLEHLAYIGDIFRKFQVLLRPEGYISVFLPNTGQEAMDMGHWGGKWSNIVGRDHTMAFDYDWFSKVLPKEGFAITHRGPEKDQEICIIARRVGS